jgi:RNA polymerase sigma-70 factor, ECF subfamily
VDKDPDARLVVACRNGDRVAYETLLTRYERPIFNVAIRMLRDPEDARDVVQTVFVRVFEKLEQFNFEHRFYSWIYRIAINESIDVLNSRSRTSPLEDGERDDIPGEGTPLDDCQDAQRDAALQAAIMRLSPDYRAVIVLRHFVDRSYQEMAEILGVPEKTVKSRLFTARQLLRVELEAGGMSEA